MKQINEVHADMINTHTEKIL